MRLALCALVLLSPAFVAPAAAQLATHGQRFDSGIERDTIVPPRLDARDFGGVRTISIAKWVATIAGAGAAAYGFIENERADDLFDDLERACRAEPAACGRRNDDGSYVDAELEALYQDVLTHDRAAQRALLASQAGIAIGVTLFLLDLRGDERPADIPYTPPRIEAAPDPRGALLLRATVPLRF